MSEELKPAFIEDDPQPSAEEIARLKAELARKIDAAEAEIRNHRSMEPENAMTDEELIRLLTNFHYAILDSLGQAPVQLDEDGEHRTVDASRAAILAYFDRRKSGEGGEDAARLTWLEDMHTLHKAVEILYVVDGYHVQRTHDSNPIGPEFFGITLREAIDAARTEGKGNGAG